MSEQLPDIHVAFGRTEGGVLFIQAATPFLDGKQNCWDIYTPHSKLQEAESKNTQLAGLLDAAVGDYNDTKEKLQEADEQINKLKQLLLMTSEALEESLQYIKQYDALRKLLKEHRQ